MRVKSCSAALLCSAGCVSSSYVDTPAIRVALVCVWLNGGKETVSLPLES